MFHGHSDYFQITHNTKPEDHGTMNAHNHLFYFIFIMYEDPHD